MASQWYKESLCKLHLDMHCPEWHESILSNFDARAIVHTVADAGSDAMYFFTKDCYGNAYYNTHIGHKHKCIGRRDLLDEVLKEAAQIKLPIMAYYTVIWDNFAAEHHPDWCMLDADGKPLMDTVTMDDGKWRYVCHNTGYADYAAAMIREIAKGYPVAGFHLDMFNMDFGKLSCYCPVCRKLFKKQTGKELPTRSGVNETWRQFMEFRYRSVEKFAQLLRQAALEENPDLVVVMNYHGSPNFDWRVGQQPVRHSLFSDLATGETYTPMLGDMYPGMEARFLRNLVPGKPVEMVSWRMNRFTDFTVKPITQLRWEAFTCAANGATNMLIDQPFADGRLDPAAYKLIKKVFHEIRDKKEYFVGDFVRQAALYYSCKTRDFYAMDHQKKFIVPVMGAYKALIENHLCVDFLFDETLTYEIIAQYPIVFLPNVACLSEQEAVVFRDYVRNGGVLIATFDTARCDENGQLRKDFVLADVFGVQYKSTVDCDANYLRALPSPYGDEIDGEYHILNLGPVHMVRPVTAKALGDVHDSFFKRRVPQQFFSHNMHPPYKRLTDAIYVNRFGQGTCIYLPHNCDGSYADTYELPEHRKILGNIVRAHAPKAIVEVEEGPLNLEVSIRQSGKMLFVHLLCFNALRQAASCPSLNKPLRPSLRMEEPPLYKAKLKINASYKSIKTLHPSALIKTDGCCVELLIDDVHEVVVIALA